MLWACALLAGTLLGLAPDDDVLSAAARRACGARGAGAGRGGAKGGDAAAPRGRGDGDARWSCARTSRAARRPRAPKGNGYAEA